MPRGDGTGPEGQGAMTGRTAGYCVGYATLGYLNPLPGSGAFGRGGRGWRNWFYATGLPGWVRTQTGYPARGSGGQMPLHYPYAPEITPKQEADILKNRAEELVEEVNYLNKRIEELERLSEKKSK
jgi:hypothetical protein